jgi:hypothetical protein
MNKRRIGSAGAQFHPVLLGVAGATRAVDIVILLPPDPL